VRRKRQREEKSIKNMMTEMKQNRRKRLNRARDRWILGSREGEARRRWYYGRDE
jgi:hypothetical protein